MADKARPSGGGEPPRGILNRGSASASLFQEKFQAISHDPFAGSLGIELLELSPGFARLSMVVTEKMANFRGGVHGAAIFALADAAFAAAGNSPDRQGLALTVNITFISGPAFGTRLVAEAREEYLGDKTSLYRIRIEDEGGRLVAVADGLAYRK